jgi:hypothetical protein
LRIATSAAAPELLFGIAGFAGVGFGRAGPSFRLMVAHAPSSGIELGQERAKFQLTFARAEGCPLSFLISDRLAIAPCAAIDAGQLVGEGQRSDEITEPETAKVLWLCATVLARLQLNLDDFLLFELAPEIGAPIWQETFTLDGEPVYDVPGIRFGLGAGIGFRFQ